MRDSGLAILSPQLSEAVVMAARISGITPTEYVQGAVRRALSDMTLRAEAGMRPGEFAGLVGASGGWLDLQQKLRARGLVLRSENGLHLHAWPSDRRLFPLAALGLSEAALILRFRAPFPAPLTERPGRPMRRPALTDTAGKPAQADYCRTIPAGQLIS